MRQKKEKAPRKRVKDMTTAEKEVHDEKQRIKREMERQRANVAFQYIYEHMNDIERSEVNSSMIDTWVGFLNKIKAAGVRFKRKDFLVLSEGCDPFNADYSTFQKLGEWFKDQWLRFKPGAKTVHVRGLHYAAQQVSETPDAVYLPENSKNKDKIEIYDNTDSAWAKLEKAGQYARNNGLIDYDMFEDRRSRKPDVQNFKKGIRQQLWVSEHLYDFGSIGYDTHFRFPDFPTAPDFPELPSYGFIAECQQRYNIEVWIEKSTQEDVVKPICEKHKVTLVTAIGEISQSAVDEAVKRAEDCGDQATTVILYISDFDPAGQSMPVAAARKIEYSLIKKNPPVHIRLYPIILTYEQCIHYNLPSVPIKETEKRGEAFQLHHGIDGAVELDALESLCPGELAKLLDEQILRFRDETIEKRFNSKLWNIWGELGTKSKEIQKNYNMDGLKEEYKEVQKGLSHIKEKYEKLKESFENFIQQYEDEVISPFKKWHKESFDVFSEKLGEGFGQVAKELEEKLPDVNAYELPQADEIPLAESCLFDSKRSYIDQLATSKRFAGKFGYVAEDEDDDIAS